MKRVVKLIILVLLLIPISMAYVTMANAKIIYDGHEVSNELLSMYQTNEDYDTFLKKDDKGNLIDDAEFQLRNPRNDFMLLPQKEGGIKLNQSDNSGISSGTNNIPRTFNNSVPTTKSGISGEYEFLSGYNYLIKGYDHINRTYLSTSSVTKKINGVDHIFTIKNYYSYNVNHTQCSITIDLYYDNELIVFDDYYQLFDEINSTFDPREHSLSASKLDISTMLDNKGKEHFVLVNKDITEEYYFIFLLNDTKVEFGMTVGFGEKINTITGTNANLYKKDGKYYPYVKENDKLRILSYEGPADDELTVTEMIVTIKNDNVEMKKGLEHIITSESNSLEAPDFGIYADNRLFTVNDFLTTEQKNVVKGLKTFDNYQALINNANEFGDMYCDGKQSFVSGMTSSNGLIIGEGLSTIPFLKNMISPDDQTGGFQPTSGNTGVADVGVPTVGSNPPEEITLNFMSFMVINESKTPKGLEKASAVAPIMVVIPYKVESNGDLTPIGGVMTTLGALLKYDPTINYDNLGEVLNKIDNSYVLADDCGEKSDIFSYTCTTTTPDTPAPVGSPNCKGVPLIVDATSDEDLSKKLEIKAFVDGKDKISVKKNDEVTITIKLYNDAKTPSYSNKIVSKVPTDIVYVEDSASRDGIYNKDDSTITWNLDYLDSKDTIMFTYKVKIPSTATNASVYRTNASVTSTDFEVPVVSDTVQVNVGTQVDEKNPNTGDFRQTLLLFIFMISVVGVIYTFSKNTIKGI